MVAGGNEQVRGTHDYAEAWLRRRGPTPSHGTGPSEDHTTGQNGHGFYAYFEASSPNWPTVASALVSPRLSPAGPNTMLNLSFFYHMFGEGGSGLVGSLRVDAAFLAEVGDVYAGGWAIGNH